MAPSGRTNPRDSVLPRALGRTGAASADIARRHSRTRAGLGAGEGPARRCPAHQRARRRFLRPAGRAQRQTCRRWRAAALPRVYRRADLLPADLDIDQNGVLRLSSGHGRGRATWHRRGSVGHRERRAQSPDPGVQAGLAAGLAADRLDRCLRGLCDRGRLVREILPRVGDHRHAVFALAHADQHRRGRGLHRQGPRERLEGSEDGHMDQDPQAGPAFRAAIDLHGSAAVSGRGLDGADRRRDAGAEPGPGQVRLG